MKKVYCEESSYRKRIEKRTALFAVVFLLFMWRVKALVHLLPLRFHCVTVGGFCWNHTQDCSGFGIESQTL
jgi:hypothetical protein